LILCVDQNSASWSTLSRAGHKPLCRRSRRRRCPRSAAQCKAALHKAQCVESRSAASFKVFRYAEHE
jgi:hypothetical protein